MVFLLAVGIAVATVVGVARMLLSGPPNHSCPRNRPGCTGRITVTRTKLGGYSGIPTTTYRVQEKLPALTICRQVSSTGSVVLGQLAGQEDRGRVAGERAEAVGGPVASRW